MPLCAAAALPHTPQLLVRPETEDRDMVLRVHAGYAEAKRGLEAARPDVICILGGDHIEGFFLTSVPALAVYVGSSVSGKFDRYRYTFDVHEPLARAILEQGIEKGFDLAYSQDLAPRLRLLRAAPLRHARAARADRAAVRERLPPAPADARALLRVGAGASRHSRRAAGARGAPRIGRALALSG